MPAHTVEVKQAQSRLEELVGQVARGEEVILMQEARPVAKIISLAPQSARRRFGSAKGLIHMRDDFDESVEDFRTYCSFRSTISISCAAHARTASTVFIIQSRCNASTSNKS